MVQEPAAFSMVTLGQDRMQDFSSQPIQYEKDARVDGSARMNIIQVSYGGPGQKSPDYRLTVETRSIEPETPCTATIPIRPCIFSE
jgi:hypothetical protein